MHFLGRFFHPRKKIEFFGLYDQDDNLVYPIESIILPNDVGQIDYEGEIAVVIKKEVEKIREEKALDYVLGYTCANDITARDLQKKDGQWTRSKSFRTFCP